MDSPAARSLHLLSLLQSGRDWSLLELAARLQVSERTVRRDARRLRDLGYDVRSRPGPGAGYRLRPTLKVPPLLLAADEVSAIVTGLLILEAWSPQDPSVGSTRAKLEQVLPPALRRRAAATALSTQVLHGEAAPLDWAHVGAVADAVAGSARIAFDYTDQRGRRTHRTVEPYRHLLRRRRWYVVAYDVDREDWRLFRLDRMEAVTALPGHHRQHPFPQDGLERWLESNFGRGDRPSTLREGGAQAAGTGRDD